jgi:hypothetical protein
MSKTITNTSKVERNPGWLFGGNPRAIEAQEARGQQELVESEQLPVRINEGGREKLEALGVVFMPCVGDDIFRSVKLPKGWKKVLTDHSMWSNLVDDKGVVRAQIFYKAAFYDRSAHMSVNMEEQTNAQATKG